MKAENKSSKEAEVMKIEVGGELKELVGECVKGVDDENCGEFTAASVDKGVGG